MTGDQIQYEKLSQDALRGVVREVLTIAERDGLPGDHHFYIAFDTQAEGVKISQRLQAQYPDEMTVVLQHQFWDLKVTDQHFEIKLSFNNVPESLLIPFSAIKVFFDPSVPYGLQFGAAAEIAHDENHPVISMAGAGKNSDDQSTVLPPTTSPSEDNQIEGEAVLISEGDPKQDDNGKVVELDSFRKK